MSKTVCPNRAKPILCVTLGSAISNAHAAVVRRCIRFYYKERNKLRIRHHFSYTNFSTQGTDSLTQCEAVGRCGRTSRATSRRKSIALPVCRWTVIAEMLSDSRFGDLRCLAEQHDRSAFECGFRFPSHQLETYDTCDNMSVHRDFAAKPEMKLLSFFGSHSKYDSSRIYLLQENGLLVRQGN